MVLSRIILSAFIALGSIAVALPVVPGDVAGTTPTPGSGAPLPYLQGSLAVGDAAVPLEDGMKGVSPLVGGSSSPHGNEAGSNISRRQSSSAAGNSSNVPPPETNASSLSAHPFEARKEELLRQINSIKNYPNVHKNYKAIVDRLSSTLNKAPRTQTPDDYFYVAKDSFSVGILASIIEVYMPPHTGNQSSRNPGDSRQKNRKIRQAFAKGRDADILLAITRNQ
ncbi:hypothetical protein EV359DRAFT_80513 [Lentinula novae-zelandiae]|nr:hypothetical protein EV359DRAFT_80513 [Lentinula novae-zelandiae]